MRKVISNVSSQMLQKMKKKPGSCEPFVISPPKALQDKKAQFNEQFELLRNARALNLKEIEILLKLLNSYHSEGRPSFYSELESYMTPRFYKVLTKLPFDRLIDITHSYFQFAKTVKPEEQQTNSRQKKLAKTILNPFYRQLKIFKKQNIYPKLHYERNSQNIFFLTRHASTQGTYAPGKLIFTMVKSLLDAGKNVQVVSLGDIDDTFKDLMKERENFHVYQKKNVNGFTHFTELREEIKKFSPQSIFTEIEVSTLVSIELFKLPSPIYFISAGYCHIPWHSGILLTQELAKQVVDFNLSKKVYQIPQTHLKESLAPYCDPVILAQSKMELGISKHFTIGSFGRYEKFSQDFLFMSKTILESIPNTKIILAGPNEQSLANEILHDFIVDNRVKLLGSSNISVLGYCCDVFLDTFPQNTGFAALESMAKGRPVFSMESEIMEFFKSNRVRRLIFKSQKQLINCLKEVAIDKEFYNKLSLESIELIDRNVYNVEGLVGVLMRIIHEKDF